MRFLHLADLHLDTSFAGRTRELRERLREAPREALERAVERALAEEVDAVLVAGDLFDGERLSFRTERILVEALERLTAAGITVVYATGNHDPGGTGGAASRVPWPEGVEVLAGPEPRRIPVSRGAERVGWVTGAGHATAREGEDLSLRFPAPEGRLPEVALLHTQVLGSRGEAEHDRYAPSELSRLQGAGFDYWALGHIHLRQTLSTHPPIYYPGNLQGRHPGESGPKGGLLVELTPGGGAVVEFVELAPVRWKTVRVDALAEVHRLAGLAAAVRRAWTAARESASGSADEFLLRVELAGPSPLHRELGEEENLRELERELRVSLDLLDVEIRAGGVRPAHDPDEHRGRVDVLGESLALLEGIAGGEVDGPAALLGVGAGELAGLGEREPEEYLVELLRGEAPALLDALLDPEASG